MLLFYEHTQLPPIVGQVHYTFDVTVSVGFIFV